MIAVAAVFAMVLVTGNSLMAAPQLSDSFTITVTVQYLNVTLRNEADDADFTAWDLGTLKALDTAYAMGATQGVRVKYSTNVSIDIETLVSAEGNWTVGGAVGVDTFKLEADISDTPSEFVASDLVLTDAAQAIAADVAAGNESKYIYYQLTTPNDVSVVPDKCTSGNIVVTIAVTPA
jgi:hypothetical protein